MHSQWEDFSYIQSVIEKKRSGQGLVSMTLASGIDYIVKWDLEAINRWYSELTIDPAGGRSEGLNDSRDFLRLIYDMIAGGSGIDIQINTLELCKELEKRFRIEEYTVAGTAAQGACALAKMGFYAALHTTVMTKKLRSLMASPFLLTEENGQLKSLTEEDAKPDDREYAPHFIFQYSPGDEIVVNGKSMMAGKANRLILTYDRKNMMTPINDKYFRALQNSVRPISSMVVSGFNTIVSKEIIIEKVREIARWIERLYSYSHDIVFYFEGAAYHTRSFIPFLYDRLGGIVDVLGFNEDELKDIMEINNIRFDIANYKDLLSALRFLEERYNPRLGIVFHTKDYSLYLGKKTRADIEGGLHLGNLMAAAKARTGYYGDLDSLRECLSVPLSREGMKLYEFAGSHGEEECIVAPNRALEMPKSTIGLGDTFTAGMQLAFIN